MVTTNSMEDIIVFLARMESGRALKLDLENNIEHIKVGDEQGCYLKVLMLRSSVNIEGRTRLNSSIQSVDDNL